MNKNFIKTSALMLLVVAFLATACSPENVAPTLDNTPEVAASGGNHNPPPNPCGQFVTFSLVNPTYGTAASFGTVTVGNDKKDLYVGITPGAGMLVTNCAFWSGRKGSVPPIDLFGQMVPTNWPNFTVLNPPALIYSFKKPLKDMFHHNDISVFATIVMLDPTGQPVFTQMAYGNGNTFGGGYLIPYTPQICPNMPCQPWTGAPNPCSSGVKWTPGKGDNGNTIENPGNGNGNGPKRGS